MTQIQKSNIRKIFLLSAFIIFLVVYIFEKTTSNNHNPIIIGKSFYGENGELLPPGICNYSFSLNSIDSHNFQDSSYKYSIGDTITGKLK